MMPCCETWAALRPTRSRFVALPPGPYAPLVETGGTLALYSPSDRTTHAHTQVQLTSYTKEGHGASKCPNAKAPTALRSLDQSEQASGRQSPRRRGPRRRAAAGGRSPAARRRPAAAWFIHMPIAPGPAKPAAARCALVRGERVLGEDGRGRRQARRRGRVVRRARAAAGVERGRLHVGRVRRRRAGGRGRARAGGRPPFAASTCRASAAVDDILQEVLLVPEGDRLLVDGQRLLQVRSICCDCRSWCCSKS